MAITEVQQGGANFLDAQPVVVLGSTPTEGNLLVATAAGREFTDLTPAGWTTVVTGGATSTNRDLTIAYKVAGAGESATVTFASSSTARGRATVYEFSSDTGWDANPVDTFLLGTQDTSPSTIGPTSSTTAAETVAVACFGAATPLPSRTWGNGFTEQDYGQATGSQGAGSSATAFPTSIGTVTATITFTGAANGRGAVAVFKPAAGGGSTPNEGSVTGSLVIGSGAPAYRSHTSQNVAPTTSITLAAPSGVVAGDQQFCLIGLPSGDADATTTDGDWTLIAAVENPHAAGGAGENERLELWYSDTDTGDVTFTKATDTHIFNAVRIAYRGSTGYSSVLTDIQSDDNTRTDTHVIPSQTTTVVNSMIVAFLTGEQGSAQTWTPPAGWTERYDEVSLSDFLQVLVADLEVASPSTVSGAAYTTSGVTWSTVASVILAPAGAVTGVAPTVSASSGAVTGSVAVDGSVAGSKSPKGSATGSVVLSGSVTGSAPPKGTVTGTLVVAGSTTGTAPANGSATGAVAVTGTVTGTAPLVGVNDGTVLGSVAVTGTVTGARDSSGSVSGSLVLAGTVTGQAADDVAGAVSGAVVVAGSVTGSMPTEGSVTGFLLVPGSATGEAPIIPDLEGSVTGALVLAGDATGKRVAQALSSGLLHIELAVTGATPKWYFEPPTYNRAYKPPPLAPGMMARFHLDQAVSVVRVNGTFRAWQGPSSELLEAAGAEGTDYFLGGRIYPEVEYGIAQELIAAGFQPTPL